MKRRSLTIDEVEGLELDPNLEEPLKAKLRRESRQGFYINTIKIYIYIYRAISKTIIHFIFTTHYIKNKIFHL